MTSESLKSLQSAMRSGNHQEIASILGIDIGDTGGMIDRIGELEQLNDELVKKVKYLNGELPKWKYCEHSMPDSDETVLVFCPDSAEPIWLGFWDGSEWRTIDSIRVQGKVTHWMNTPDAPEKPEPEGDN